MKTCLILLGFALSLPAYGQTMYKCPTPAGTVTFQQMPCTPQGGGEAVEVKTAPSGTGSGLSEEGKAYLEEREKARQEARSALPPPAPVQASNKEESDPCVELRWRIIRLEEREAQGIHTWSKHGYEESDALKEKYQKLCKN